MGDYTKKRGIILILALVILVAFSQITYAASLRGTVYDFSLNSLNDVVISVDTTPTQRFVSKQGQYEFKLSPGEYTITAEYNSDDNIKFTVEETIQIVEEGEFIYDLFLFPDLSEEEDLLDDPLNDTYSDDGTDNGSEPVIPSGPNYALYILILALLIGIGYLIYVKFVKHKKIGIDAQVEEIMNEGKNGIDEDLQQVIDVVKKHGNRTTQKELRKEIPLSEAKVSLMVSELEDKGILKKIKKGRGNIIVLVKK
ncbi:hypothetical protein HOK51_02275 [Candidatus Woesearchaeota archaeon]|jgi:uncharacterized membrane protein|nr:hypothetical protein [Candidatus Woesearchaeota archaeon]MBT6518643.1 hypothetical protein [Candidatus Woesearchaeota archaeon]